MLDIKPFSKTYRELLIWVLNSPSESNNRTGTCVRVGHGGTSFALDLSDNILPTIGCRKTFPGSAAAELAWYLSGEQDATFISRQAPLWDKFLEQSADGSLVVKAAYGYRWRRHFGRDQIALAIKALNADVSDRRVYVSAWDPSCDGLGAVEQVNVPCPTAFSFSVSGGRLHSSLFLRSSDVFVGLPYDVMGHALLMDAMAVSLDLPLGIVHVTLAHAHLYDSHWVLAHEALEQKPVVPDMPMSINWSVSDIEQNPDSYVEDCRRAARSYDWPEFNPRPEVIV